MQSNSSDAIRISEKTASRKDRHVDLALKSQVTTTDPRFYYEPMIAAHPDKNETWETAFGDKKMKFPIWISSMTGGTQKTNEINKRLATTAGKFGLGMGVGSIRIAIEDPSKEKDFAIRKYLGSASPFYINFGIAQIEQFLKNREIPKLIRLKKNLDADGFIIHVNPLQEWMQPEGDHIVNPPVETIGRFLNETNGIPLIVKEVGQGYGPASMKALLQLPLMAIEFAAHGGTNFSKVELERNEAKGSFMQSIINVGQTADEMVNLLNDIITKGETDIKTKTVIVSGGLKDFLDGYYYIRKARLNAIYGHASKFLKYALQSQEALDEFTGYQTEGLLLARAFLKLKEK